MPEMLLSCSAGQRTCDIVTFGLGCDHVAPWHALRGQHSLVQLEPLQTALTRRPPQAPCVHTR